MKKYTLSFADAINHTPDHPERTARRNGTGVLDFDVRFQVWNSRAAMLKTIEMQERGNPRPGQWKACKVQS